MESDESNTKRTIAMIECYMDLFNVTCIKSSLQMFTCYPKRQIGDFYGSLESKEDFEYKNSIELNDIHFTKFPLINVNWLSLTLDEIRRR